MIVGNGDIASAIIDRPDLLFFCSGVSNSGETNVFSYLRERRLLLAQPRDEHLVYFSSLCVFYSRTPYADHKRDMEITVRQTFRRYTIMRLGNITWGVNPHTLINHLRARAALGLPLDIQPVYRYVINLPEFRHWLGLIPPWACEMNCPGRRMLVSEIVKEYVLGDHVPILAGQVAI